MKTGFCFGVGVSVVLLGFVGGYSQDAPNNLSQPTNDRSIELKHGTRGFSVKFDQALFEPTKDYDLEGNAGLFIGVNEYKEESLRDLEFAVNDAIALAYLHVFELKLIPPAHCHLLLEGKPSQGEIAEKLKQLRHAGAVVNPATRTEILSALETALGHSASKLNFLVFSMSSHGFGVETDAILVPSDGRTGTSQLIKDTTIALSRVEADMDNKTKCRAGHRLILVDACQSRIRAKSGGVPAGEGASEALIRAMKKSSGQAKLISCSQGEISSEMKGIGRSQCGHGLFTCAYLEALQGRAAADQENIIRLEAVSNYLQDRVPNLAARLGRKQNPFIACSMRSLREMPMAVKASDLKTVLKQLRGYPTDEKFTAQLQASLIDLLANGDANHKSYPELLAETRSFVANRTSSRLFVPYAIERINTLSSLPKPGAPLKSMLNLGLVWCPPGKFLMGSTVDEPGHQSNEDLALVSFDDGFWIGKCEVTQAEWLGLFDDPSDSLRSLDFADQSLKKETDGILGEGARFPMYHVSRKLALAYCRQLTTQEKKQKRLPTGWTFTLPTEAQWEYACRAGSTTATSFGDSLSKADANYNSTSTQPVGQHRANKWGLFDMHGNVAEWCLDDVGFNQAKPKGVIRGGSWVDDKTLCRSASRTLVDPAVLTNRIGFRIVLVKEQ